MLVGDAIVSHPFSRLNAPLPDKTKSQYIAGIFNLYTETMSILLCPICMKFVNYNISNNNQQRARGESVSGGGNGRGGVVAVVAAPEAAAAPAVYWHCGGGERPTERQQM